MFGTHTQFGRRAGGVLFFLFDLGLAFALHHCLLVHYSAVRVIIDWSVMGQGARRVKRRKQKLGFDWGFVIIGFDRHLQIYFICLYIRLVVFSVVVESIWCTYLFLAISVLISCLVLYIYFYYYSVFFFIPI